MTETPNAPMMKPLGMVTWWMLLEQERQCCRICRNEGITPIEPLVPFKPGEMDTKDGRTNHRAKRKATFQRHIRDAHPSWIDRVDWSVTEPK